MEYSEQYLTYGEYTALGGTQDQTPFNLLEYDVRRIIDKKTFNRLRNTKTIPKEIKECVFNIIQLKESINNGVEISGNAINYKQEEINAHIEEMIESALFGLVNDDGIPYLYLGVDEI